MKDMNNFVFSCVSCYLSGICANKSWREHLIDRLNKEVSFAKFPDTLYYFQGLDDEDGNGSYDFIDITGSVISEESYYGAKIYINIVIYKRALDEKKIQKPKSIDELIAKLNEDYKGY